MIGRLGDRRMSERTAVIEGLLQTDAPEPVLFRLVLDALGFARNRVGMAAVADRLPWSVLASITRRRDQAFPDLAALLLGAGGYLPMSDTEIERAGIDPMLAPTLTVIWQQLQNRLRTCGGRAHDLGSGEIAAE